jgi:hypothetical protein
MEAIQLLSKARSLGIKFSVKTLQLVVDAPKGAITEEIRQAVREHKSEIMELITARRQQDLQQPTNAYMSQRMLELGLTKEDIRGETDPSLALDEDELSDIRNDKLLFDIWVEHVHRTKQLKALELAKQKQAEEYSLGDTLGSLPFDHKFKLIEHMLTTFKKFLFGERYKGEVPNALFVECWYLANHDLTLEQLFNASAEFTRLAKNANDCGDNAELKRLREIVEGTESFRRFCLSNAENANNEFFH